MFTISKIIGNYARNERYYISSARYTAWYTLAVLVRVLELAVIICAIYLFAVIILSL